MPEADAESGVVGEQVTLVPRSSRGHWRSTRYHAVKAFGLVADEILVHLQAEGQVEVVVEIRATSVSGFTDSVVRTVTENAKVLGFVPGAGFERD